MKDEPQADQEPASPDVSDLSPQKFPGPPRTGPVRLDAADVLPLLETVLRRWRWLVIGGAALGILGFTTGIIFWKNSYTAPAQLLRYDSPNAAEIFGNRQAAPETLPSILHSPELLQRVSAKADPPVSADVFAGSLRVMPEHDSDIIVVAVTGKNPDATVSLANLYAREAVRFTQEMQARSANEVIQFATQQLAQIEFEINSADQQAQHSSPAASPAAIAPQTSTLVEKIQAARDDLAGLLARYTDVHPLVQAKRAEIGALEKGAATAKRTGRGGKQFSAGGSRARCGFRHQITIA